MFTLNEYISSRRALFALSTFLICCCPSAAAIVACVNACVPPPTPTQPVVVHLQLSSASASAGQVETFTVTANSFADSSVPLKSGQVAFEDETTTGACTAGSTSLWACTRLGTAQLTSMGEAILRVRLGAGSHHIIAHFLGDRNYFPSWSREKDLAVIGTSKVTIQSGGKAGSYNVTGTVVVNGALAATGPVTFVDQINKNLSLGTQTLGTSQASQSFAPQAKYGANHPSFEAVGDFNGDGILDLVVLNESKALGILLGHEDGTFASQAEVLVNDDYGYIAVGDFNGDGIPDLVLTDGPQGTVAVMLGNGDATFQPAITRDFGDNAGALPGDFGAAITVGDFNGDGIPDVAVVNLYFLVPTTTKFAGGSGFAPSTHGRVNVLHGKGDGSFGTPAKYDVGASPTALAVGDFDGDGVADLVVSNSGDNTVSTLLGRGDGSFLAPKTSPSSTGGASVALGDFNRDGILDLAIAGGGSGKLGVQLGKGDGTFQTPQILDGGDTPVSVAAGDVNGDGIADLAVANSASASVLLGKGDGTFQAPIAYAAGSPAFIVMADFDGDGVPDLTIANSKGNAVGVFLNQLKQTTSVSLSHLAILGGGVHPASASYAGDSYHQPNDSGFTLLTGSLITATLNLATAPGLTVTAGQTVTLTATLDRFSEDNYTATGSVTFSDNGMALGNAQLTNGTATLKAALPAGKNSLTAIYSGDANFTTDKSVAEALTVGPVK